MNDIAADMGNARALNMIALGAVVAATKAVPLAAVEQAFVKRFGNKPGVVDANMQAVHAGIDCVANQ